jgi:transcriptional regulator with XRE-family HTH domain
MLVIGERLRAIRESKNLSQGDIEQRTGMLPATLRASKTATRFRQSIRSRSMRRRSKFHCINFFTMMKRRQRRSKR